MVVTLYGHGDFGRTSIRVGLDLAEFRDARLNHRAGNRHQVSSTDLASSMSFAPQTCGRLFESASDSWPGRRRGVSPMPRSTLSIMLCQRPTSNNGGTR